MGDPESNVPAPDTGEEEEEKEALRRCRKDKDKLTPRETGHCAGLEIMESYDQEEVGGG